MRSSDAYNLLRPIFLSDSTTVCVCCLADRYDKKLFDTITKCVLDDIDNSTWVASRLGFGSMVLECISDERGELWSVLTNC